MQCPLFEVVVFECFVRYVDGKQLSILARTCKRFLQFARRHRAYIEHRLRVRLDDANNAVDLKIGWHAMSNKIVSNCWLRREMKRQHDVHLDTFNKTYKCKLQFLSDFFACDQWKCTAQWIDQDDTYVSLLRYAPAHKTTGLYPCTNGIFSRLQKMQKTFPTSFMWRTIIFRDKCSSVNTDSHVQSLWYVIGNHILVNGTYIQLMFCKTKVVEPVCSKKRKLTSNPLDYVLL